MGKPYVCVCTGGTICLGREQNLCQLLRGVYCCLTGTLRPRARSQSLTSRSSHTRRISLPKPGCTATGLGWCVPARGVSPASIVTICPTARHTARPDTLVADLLDILLEEKIGAVPVLAPNTGDLIGIVSYLDVLRAVHPFMRSA